MAQILYMDGEKKDITDFSLESLQKAVGGLIELIQFPDGSEMVINEEGKLMSLAVNKQATEIWLNHYDEDCIVGDVVFWDKDDKERMK